MSAIISLEDEMKSPERITIALDEETASLFKKMKEDLGVSQSELMREALKFYGKHKTLFEFTEDKNVYTHAEMLSAGEHVILDIDHWILFLNFIDSHPEKERFWNLIRRSARHMQSNSSTSSTTQRASSSGWRPVISSR